MIYLEGFGNIMNFYFQLEDSDHIPADLLIQSLTFGPDYDKSEIGEKWIDMAYLQHHYIKLFCSRSYKQGDSTHFFMVYKKRLLVKPGRDLIFQERKPENLNNPLEDKF